MKDIRNRNRIGMQEGGQTYSDEDVKSYIQGIGEAGGGDKEIAAAMDKYNVSAEQVGRATGLDTSQVQARYDVAKGSGTPQTPELSETGGTKVSPVDIVEDTDEILLDQQLDTLADIDAKQAEKPDEVAKPTEITPEDVTATTVSKEDLGTSTAAVGTLSDQAKVGEIQGTVSTEALAEGVTGVPSPEATVKFQMADLMKSIEEGEPLPPWAAPAARAVGAVMQQRGLGE